MIKQFTHAEFPAALAEATKGNPEHAAALNNGNLSRKQRRALQAQYKRTLKKKRAS